MTDKKSKDQYPCIGLEWYMKMVDWPPYYKTLFYQKRLNNEELIKFFLFLVVNNTDEESSLQTILDYTEEWFLTYHVITQRVIDVENNTSFKIVQTTSEFQEKLWYLKENLKKYWDTLNDIDVWDLRTDTIIRNAGTKIHQVPRPAPGPGPRDTIGWAKYVWDKNKIHLQDYFDRIRSRPDYHDPFWDVFSAPSLSSSGEWGEEL